MVDKTKTALPQRNHNFEGGTARAFTENVFCFEKDDSTGWYKWRVKSNRKAPYDFFITAPSTNSKRKFDSFKISAVQFKHLKEVFLKSHNEKGSFRDITISRVAVKIYNDRFIVKGTAYGHNIKFIFMFKRPEITVEFYNGYHSSIKSFNGYNAAGKQAGTHVENIMKSWVRSGMIDSWFTEDMKFFGPFEMMQQ